MNNLPPGLPPGVTDSMIPGNRPEDEAFERIIDGPIGQELEENAMEYEDLVEDVVEALRAIRESAHYCEVCDRRTNGAAFCSARCAAVEDVGYPFYYERD